MRPRILALISFGALVLGGACAFPEIDFKSNKGNNGPGQGPGAAGPTTSGAGMGGSNVGGQGAGGNPVTTNGGNGGAGGPPMCEVGDPMACSATEKCTVIDNATGETGCRLAGVQGPWTRCNGDSDCANDLWCDLLTNVCKPVCEGAVECPNTNAQCLPAMDGGVAIPNLKICASNCNPLSADPCNDTNGQVTCFYSGNGTYWDCIRTDNLTENTPCMGQDMCADGLVCPTDSNICELWCEINNDQCPGFDTCVGTNPMILYEGEQMGICT